MFADDFDEVFHSKLLQEIQRVKAQIAHEENERQKERGRVFRVLMSKRFDITVPSPDNSCVYRQNGITFELMDRSYGWNITATTHSHIYDQLEDLTDLAKRIVEDGLSLSEIAGIPLSDEPPPAPRAD